MDLPKMLTINEAAQLSRETGLGLSRNAIRQLSKQNVIPCIRIGTKTLVNWQGMLDYLNNPAPQLLTTPQSRIRPVSERNTA